MDTQDQSKLLIQPTGDRLDYRVGELPKIQSLIKDSQKGVITAPGDYFKKKYLELGSSMFPADWMLVTYSASEREITYHENVATDVGGQKIIGKLSLESNLKSLGINGNKSYSPQELSNSLNMLRVLFADKDKWISIVKNLKNFTAEAVSTIEKENDDKGNKKDSLVQKLKTSFDLDFELSASVFEGFTDKSTFKVEILVNVRSSALEMYLQSVELKEIIDTKSLLIIKNELDKFENKIPLIQLS